MLSLSKHERCLRCFLTHYTSRYGFPLKIDTHEASH